MFCTNCGNNLESGDNFCGKCGKAVRSAQASKIEPPVFQKPVINKEPEYTPPITPARNKTKEAKAEKKREEQRAELRKILEKEQGREITDQELFESEHWLRNYAELMLDLYIKDEERKKKLEENPKGFHLEGEGYSCFICHSSISKEETWYDQYGIKCLTCQSAIDKKIIPATAASDKDSWYTTHDFEHHFFINRFGVKKLVKEGLLKPRIVPDNHCQLFFIEDHKDILPPKKLTEWPTVKYQKDGEDWYTSEPWIMHRDPKEVLKGYKILELLGMLEEKHINKSFGQLSYQLNKSARSMLKVDYVDSKAPKGDGSNQADKPPKETK